MSQENSDQPKELEIKAQPSEQGFITLPFNDEQFRSFINSLLGSPQSVGRVIQEPFEINNDNLVSLHQLIHQRIIQQNNGTLARFLAKIVYSDNSFVDLNSIIEVTTYNPVRAVYARSITLVWDYIIKFHDKSAPEKQRIQVTFDISEFSTIIDSIDLRHIGDDSISFRIEHTARTWANDMEALIGDYLQTVLVKESSLKKWIVKHEKFASGLVGFFSGTLIAIMVGLFAYSERLARVLKNKEYLSALSLDISGVIKRVDFIIENGTNAFRSGGADSALLGAFIGFISGYFVFNIVLLNITQRPSFILTTKWSDKYKESTMQKYNRSWWYVIGSVVFAIIMGVVSNIIYTYIAN